MAGAFLRIPPFPGHRAPPLAIMGDSVVDDVSAADLTRLLREKRVGGSFWAAQPELPKDRDLLLAPSSREQALEMLATARSKDLVGRCVMLNAGKLETSESDLPIVAEPADPWHLVESCSQIWVGGDNELALVAALAGKALRTFGEGRFGEVASQPGLVKAVRDEARSWSYRCPFSDEPIAPDRAIELLSDWRSLIDRNRRISTILGVAGWKRPTVDAMLWGGAGAPPYAASLPLETGQHSTVIAWKSRTPARILERLGAAELPVAEIEDGLIRGRGLGANCVPPLSVVVDYRGIYFDPSQPSDLEQILETADMDSALTDRAARLRQMIVEAGISKYDAGGGTGVESGAGRRILVVGQVEDDRSVLSGGRGQTNFELLQRARAIEPDAWLIYRPHPDVEAGHRKGHIPDQQALKVADEVERGGSIGALIERVDGIHCITSQAGFEALLRGKPVTTHGVPFYAGWGLTTDLAEIPPRRTRRRSLDELVAAALILYPRYVDPVTRLPCSPEVLVERIARGEDMVKAPLAGVRALQGRLNVAFRSLREAVA